MDRPAARGRGARPPGVFALVLHAAPEARLLRGALGLLLQERAVEGVGEELGQRGVAARDAPALLRDQGDGQVARELAEDLTAEAARRPGARAARRDGEPHRLRLARGDHRANGGALGADGATVGRVLDVAPG